MPTPTDEIHQILTQWAERTRLGQLDEVLSNHAPNVLIYDVLPPLKYESAAAYRASWGDWHPETPADGTFEWQDLTITTGLNPNPDIAFATGFLLCGGTAPNGHVFSDTVRATFCLQKLDNAWKITHQHISKPFSPKFA